MGINWFFKFFQRTTTSSHLVHCVLTVFDPVMYIYHPQKWAYNPCTQIHSVFFSVCFTVFYAIHEFYLLISQIYVNNLDFTNFEKKFPDFPILGKKFSWFSNFRKSGNQVEILDFASIFFYFAWFHAKLLKISRFLNS